MQRSTQNRNFKREEYIDLIQERLPFANERELRLIYIFIDEIVPNQGQL